MNTTLKAIALKVVITTLAMLGLSQFMNGWLAFLVIWIPVGFYGVHKMFPEMFAWKKPGDWADVLIPLLGIALGLATFIVADELENGLPPERHPNEPNPFH